MSAAPIQDIPLKTLDGDPISLSQLAESVTSFVLISNTV